MLLEAGQVINGDRDHSPSPTPETVHAQMCIDIAAQQYREAVRYAVGAAQGTLRPLGGMASASAFGSRAGGAAVELLHGCGLC